MYGFNNLSGCYNCKERCVGCHSCCEKYAKYKKLKDVIKKKKEEYRILNMGGFLKRAGRYY